MVFSKFFPQFWGVRLVHCRVLYTRLYGNSFWQLSTHSEGVWSCVLRVDHISRNFSLSNVYCFILNIEYQTLAKRNFSNFWWLYYKLHYVQVLCIESDTTYAGFELWQGFFLSVSEVRKVFCLQWQMLHEMHSKILSFIIYWMKIYLFYPV